MGYLYAIGIGCDTLDASLVHATRYMNQDSAKDAFLASFDEYGDAIFRFCMVKTSNRELAEDLTQETFMRYWQALRDGKDMANARAFLYTIARNLIIDWYRKRKSDSLDDKMDAGMQVADVKGSIEEDAVYAEVIRTMVDLADSDAEILVLRYVEGMEPREIAEVIGETANTVSVRLNRAVKRLQSRLHI